MQQFIRPFRGNQYFKHKIGGGGGGGGSLNSSGPSLGPPEIPFSGCAPKGNRMEIVLGIKVVFTNTFNNSMTGRKELIKTVNIIHF